MKASPLATLFNQSGRSSFEVRVRGTIFLWGSAGVTENITFDKAPVLHIHNDVFGEAISFGSRVASGAEKAMGTLQPGECMSIPLQGISGVFAVCSLESTVGCIIN